MQGGECAEKCHLGTSPRGMEIVQKVQLSASRSARTLYMEKLKLTRFSGKQATALK
jgi:hypothetical protein